jgi:hypothetical protein
MSVLVPDLKVFEAVYNKAWLYGFNKVCDINYCHTLSFSDEEKLKTHVKNWLWLNEMSWIRMYEDNGQKPDLVDFLTFRNGKNINTYQMLKYLQCIDYNIEIETIKTGKTGHEDPFLIPDNIIDSYNLLKKAIEEIQNVIISQLPEYEEAKWSEI